MAGIQFGFSDGTNSTLIQSEKAVKYKLKRVDIDPTRRVHAISVLAYQGRNFEGLRLYDENMEYILDLTWDVDYAG